MPDETHQSDDETPVTLEIPGKVGSSPSNLLAKLEEVLQKRSGKNGMITSIVVVVVIMIASLAWSWIRSRHADELANLRHEKEKALLLAEQKEFADKIHDNDQQSSELQGYLKAAQRVEREAIDAYNDEALALQANRDAIVRILSWDDAGVRRR